MYYKGRCADLSSALGKEVALSWDVILEKGEAKGDVTVEESEFGDWRVISDFMDSN